jgi:hypothetical protein
MKAALPSTQGGAARAARAAHPAQVSAGDWVRRESTLHKSLPLARKRPQLAVRFLCSLATGAISCIQLQVQRKLQSL